MLYVDFHILYFANILVSYAASTQQREAVGRFEILLFWLQEHTKKYNQMIISSINEVNKVDTTNRCKALKEVMSLNYVSYQNISLATTFILMFQIIFR